MPAMLNAKRSASLVLLAALAIWPQAAGAQEVPTVRIGQATKKTVGAGLSVVIWQEMECGPGSSC